MFVLNYIKCFSDIVVLVQHENTFIMSDSRLRISYAESYRVFFC